MPDWLLMSDWLLKNKLSEAILKFDFSILTKDRQPIESIVISGIDQNEAERKLKQMYRYCEIVRCEPKDEAVGSRALQALSVEDILTLISK